MEMDSHKKGGNSTVFKVINDVFFGIYKFGGYKDYYLLMSKMNKTLHENADL